MNICEADKTQDLVLFFDASKDDDGVFLSS